MIKEELIKLKRELSKFSETELKVRDLQYIRKLATGEIQGPPVGYASIDKPWLGYYPEILFSERKKYNKIIDYIKDVWVNDMNDVMMHYYGMDITAKEFFDNVTSAAKSLKSLGLVKGDTIVTNLDGVPEFTYLFYAAEIIGVNVKNKIGADGQEIVDVINESNAKCFFAHDFMARNDFETIYNETNIKNIVVVNPVEHLKGDFSLLRPHIKEYISSMYKEKYEKDCRDISWNEFISLGKKNTEDIYVVSDENTKLFSAYTSGSTGARKEVIHSSKTILEMLDQMVFPTPPSEVRDTWLWPVYPPSLVAVVIAYMCMPLVQGRKVVLDPYFDYKDIDLEMMHYEPNSTGLVLIILEELIRSKRIPDDYDMSYLKVLGFGAETLTTAIVCATEDFLKKHNCEAPLNGGYGNSEGGSEITIAFNNEVLKSGSNGFPLINSVLSVFEPGTEYELGYGEIGELCKTGAGNMMGYATTEDTEKVLKLHSDGHVWLHTNDLGYMNQAGFVYVFGREGIKVYTGKEVYPLTIENKVASIDGVQNAIVVSGDSKKYNGYQTPYLFIVPAENVDKNQLILTLNEVLEQVLNESEKPEEMYIIDSKPVSHFKVDRKILRKKYNITTNNK